MSKLIAGGTLFILFVGFVFFLEFAVKNDNYIAKRVATFLDFTAAKK